MQFWQPVVTQSSNPTDPLNLDLGTLSSYDNNALAKYIQHELQSHCKGIELPLDKLFVEGTKYVLAGGALRSYFEGRPSARDLDIYCLNEEVFKGIWTYVKEHNKASNVASKGFRPKAVEIKFPYKRLYVITVNPTVQIMGVRYLPDYTSKRSSGSLPSTAEELDMIWATNSSEILDGFDFTCCAAGLVFEVRDDVRDESSTNSKPTLCFKSFRHKSGFLSAIMRKELSLQSEANQQQGGVLFQRLVKYYEYGYRVLQPEFFAEMEWRKELVVKQGGSSLRDYNDDSF